MKTTTNLGFKKIELTDSPPDITVQDPNWDLIDKHLYSAVSYQKAGGTAAAITLAEVTLTDGFCKTFIVAASNAGAATTINSLPLYKPGTTTAPNLVAGKAVTVWYDATSSCFFIKASAEGDATVANVLAGKKFSNDNDTGLTGTMANRGAVIITPGTSNQTIAEGYHSGSGYVVGDSDLISTNIKSGITIFGVSGNTNVVDTSAGDAVASNILSGKKAYVDGALVTGNISSKAAATITPGTADQTIAAGQYLSGIQTIKGDADLLATNLRNGIDIFGIVGNALVADYCAQISGLAATVGFSVAGKITLNWTNPTDGLIKGVRIMYKTDSYPTSPTDGTVFYDSADGTLPTTATVTGLTEGTTYYIRAFAYTYQNATRLYTTATSGAQCTALPYRNQGIQTFTASGTFTVPYGVTELDVFCVGGGGGGFSTTDGSGPGGGGGGYTGTVKKVVVSPNQQYAVVVGSGGPAKAAGGSSSFGSVLTVQGGSPSPAFAGGSGGSGGGGGSAGMGAVPPGGAGGSNGSNGVGSGGAAGIGQGSTTYAFAESNNTLYAGGGGGSTGSNSTYFTGGAGGAGGGGAGGYYVAAGVAGSINTGGGGGGGNPAGAGGSGVVIVRWGY